MAINTSQGDDHAQVPNRWDKDLLISKAIKPPTEAQLQELSRIARLDVSTYSEADVRATIIDPIVRILGYDKETDFSVNREKPLKVQGADLFVDYELTLWQEAFWVLEAKKVNRQELKFTKNEILQALNYAAHPDINAALMVLCDGRIIEIYDREESLSIPVERIAVADIVEKFDRLQAYLSPWQSWFFQKSRIPRLIDKVMDREMTVGRIEELREAINDKLYRKEAIARDNRRRVLSTVNVDDERRQFFRSLTLRELVEDLMFAVRSHGDVKAIASAIVDKGGAGGFAALVTIFDDLPRNMNDAFVAYSLRVLMEYENRDCRPTWLPDWLCAGLQSRDTHGAICNLIRLALDSFADDPARRVVLQYSACARRIAKILLAVLPSTDTYGKHVHGVIRHHVDELSELQLLSTPQRAVVLSLDTIQHHMTSQFVRRHRDDHGRFNLDGAKTVLRDAWSSEAQFLQDGKQYASLVKGRGLADETHPTEMNWVGYDQLGHVALCILDHDEKWAGYVKANHSGDLKRIAAMGSWKARNMLGGVAPPPLSDQARADRFFEGDVALNLRLYAGYSALKGK